MRNRLSNKGKKPRPGLKRLVGAAVLKIAALEDRFLHSAEMNHVFEAHLQFYCEYQQTCDESFSGFARACKTLDEAKQDETVEDSTGQAFAYYKAYTSTGTRCPPLF
jgi:hypothetical protein